jgi:hypothetical protein
MAFSCSQSLILSLVLFTDHLQSNSCIFFEDMVLEIIIALNQGWATIFVRGPHYGFISLAGHISVTKGNFKLKFFIDLRWPYVAISCSKLFNYTIFIIFIYIFARKKFAIIRNMSNSVITNSLGPDIFVCYNWGSL